jgi:hypothetical protein
MTGYHEPPEEHRFRPGQSGNPGGRPKRTQTLLQDISEELQRPTTVKVHGAQLTVTAQRAAAIRAVTAACDGDIKALSLLLGFCLRTQSEHSATPDAIPTEDDVDVERADKSSIARRKSRGVPPT